MGDIQWKSTSRLRSSLSAVGSMSLLSVYCLECLVVVDVVEIVIVKRDIWRIYMNVERYSEEFMDSSFDGSE